MFDTSCFNFIGFMFLLFISWLFSTSSAFQTPHIQFQCGTSVFLFGPLAAQDVQRYILYNSPDATPHVEKGFCCNNRARAQDDCYSPQLPWKLLVSSSLLFICSVHFVPQSSRVEKTCDCELPLYFLPVLMFQTTLGRKDKAIRILEPRRRGSLPPL